MQQLIQQFIDNQWVESRGQRRLSVMDPYRQTQIAELTAGDSADVDGAVQAARAALPGWQAQGGVRRGAYLAAFADALEARRERLVRCSSTNNGKALAEAAIDLDDAIACYRYYAGQAKALEQRQGRRIEHGMAGIEARVFEDPAGVVGLITPWNFPLVTSAWKIAPALAAGCTVVFKPSEVTPLPEAVLAEIALEVGLPAGVLNLLNGDGDGIGAPLSAHPGVDKLSFTGSNAVGEKVMQAAANGVRGVSLELGGKSPILVLDDAEVESAADWVMAGIYFNSGQICSATSRLLVHESLAEPLYQALAERIDALTLGDPLVEGTDMGPMTSARQREAVERYLEVARAEGLVAVRDGRHRDLPDQGEFVAPTLYRDVPTSSRLWREEIFGPVLCARSVASEAEAIEQANDSPFGLAATVISGDNERARRVGRALRAGSIWFNSEQLVMPEASWGGFGISGIGRELGPWGLAGYLEVKHLIGPQG
ncbi:MULTISPECIES: aldehyde dehydrogenase family protein [unclassified Halomonas]|uniref:aldehyde dehydrogenase family protein n=1 Tax=unclassified Halomonas TaxID=2609666 RepID=UPI002888ACA2|nr:MULTISPECIES: aldehyde dehydrogenase family protein [unclassified Halomonas]MDT0502701.1 aldehyde dehydrogenase family protein [Halomonas sp. PAR7]MDT0513387.1 aldehyde dehydrogenase family protein [Halomonas sp. LES1]MDT0591847.1 aldehyde dehydrogenase family protein [Halomonas sp. PAR8]